MLGLAESCALVIERHLLFYGREDIDLIGAFNGDMFKVRKTIITCTLMHARTHKHV